jgi:hypothetical protein
MSEAQLTDPQQEPPDAAESNVVVLFDGSRPRPPREPQASDDELAEYRRMLPLLRVLTKRCPELMAMLEDMDTLRSENGCPVMRNILPHRT